MGKEAKGKGSALGLCERNLLCVSIGVAPLPVSALRWCWPSLEVGVTLVGVAV